MIDTKIVNAGGFSFNVDADATNAQIAAFRAAINCLESGLLFFVFLVMFFAKFQAWGQNESAVKETAVKQEKSINFSFIGTPKLVILIIVDPYIIAEPDLDEVSFKRLGCHYKIEDSNEIFNLIDIIKNAEIRNSEDKNSYLSGISFDTREGIYLTLENGREFKFLFSSENPKEKTLIGVFNENLIIANALLPDALYRLARKMENKLARHTSCAHFLNSYFKK